MDVKTTLLNADLEEDGYKKTRGFFMHESEHKV